MADNLIQQKLGFDVSDAIKSIADVNGAFDQFNSALKDNSSALTDYSSDATKSMDQLSKAASSAKASMGKMGKLKVDTSGLDSARPSLRAFANEIEKQLGEVPAKASATLKRTVQDNIRLMAEFANSQGLTLKQVGQSWKEFGGSLNEPQARLREMMKQNQDAVSDGMKAMSKDTKTFTISWKTMLRIVVTQIIVRAMSALRTAVQEGIKATIDYGQRIGEIGTIAGGALGNLNQMSDTVKGLSLEFGKSTEQTAEGLYQTLSNQVGDAAQSLHVFRQSNKLAIATSSKTEEAVGLMTAALNGFGLGAEHAERVGGILFKTVEKGRLRVSDLADIFGRTAPLYAQMGGSLEEMSAALATMTVTGVKADTAMTQLRAIMLKLVKPSEDLKKLMHDKLGIDNAVQAVQKFGGVLPFLHELNKLTGDNVTEMAELFDRVRAVAGVLGLTSTNAERAVENMKAMREEGPTALKEAFALMESTDARKAIKAFNELKISILSLGQIALPVVTKLVKVLNTILGQGKDLAGALTAMGVAGTLAFVSMNKAALASIPGFVKVQAGVIGIGKAFLTIAPYLLAFWAGWKLGEVISDRYLTSTQDHVAKLQSQMAQSIAKDREFWAARAANMAAYYVEASSKRTQHLLSGLAAINLETQTEREALVKRHKDTVTSVNSMLKKVTDARQNVIDKIENWQNSSDSRQQKYRDTLAKQEASRDDRAFQHSLENMDKERQVLEVLARSNKLAAKTRISSATTLTRTLNAQTGQYEWIRRANQNVTEDTLKRKEAELATALAGSKQAQGLARQLGDQRLLRRAKDDELSIMKQQEDLTRKRMSHEAAIAKRLEAQKAAQRKLLQADIQSQRVIADALKLTGTGGKTKTPDEIRKGVEKAFTELDKMSLRAAKNPDLKLGNIMGLQELQATLSQFQARQIGEIKGIIRIDADDTINDLMALFANKLTPAFKAEVEKMYEIATGFKLVWNPLDTVAQAMEAATKIQKAAQVDSAVIAERVLSVGELNSRFAAMGNAASNLSEVATHQIDKQGVAFKNAVVGMAVAHTAMTDKIKANQQFLNTPAGAAAMADFEEKTQAVTVELTRLEAANAQVVSYSNTPGFTWLPTALLDLKKLRAELTNINSTTVDVKQFGAGIEAAGSEALQNIEATKNASKGAVNEMNKMVPALDNVSADATSTSSDTQTTAQALSAAVPAAQALAQSFVTMANASQSIVAPPTGGGGVQTAARGGLMNYFANGGFAPKGTDTIPAMLSPGEFVMNARSTRRFYSQLVSMNSGRQPIYRSEGGPVTNVGDINISVPGGTTDRESARNIVTRVRRELRRRSSTLG